MPAGLPYVADERTLDRVTMLTLETNLGWLDLVLEPEGSPGYEALRDRAEVMRVDDREIRVASIDDLIAMKRASGRTQDLADVEELERIKRLRDRM